MVFSKSRRSDENYIPCPARNVRVLRIVNLGPKGDTVILVRNLIFDGREAVIRGPFNINLDRAALNNRHDRQASITGPTSVYEPNTILFARTGQSSLVRSAQEAGFIDWININISCMFFTSLSRSVSEFRLQLRCLS
jgi:hypothetical protein